MKNILLTLCCLFSFSFVIAQTTTIKGTVKDTSGEGIPGANVIIKESTVGTSTDFDGNFEFKTTITGTRTLRISLIWIHPI